MKAKQRNGIEAESESKSYNDFQFPIFTESQMKEMEFDTMNDYKSNSKDKETNNESKSVFKREVNEEAFDDTTAETKTYKKKEKSNQRNWMIEANQCNIKYSPFNKSNPWENKNEIMKSLCHGFVDMFFGQKEEISSLKYEIQKLERAILQSTKYQSPLSKKKGYSIDVAVRTNHKEIKAIGLTIAKATEIQLNNRKEKESNLHSLSLDNKNLKDNAENEFNLPLKPNVKKINKASSNKVKNKHKEREKEKEKENKEELINITEIEDDEFDSMLTNLKQKKGSIPNQNNPFRKSITFIDGQAKGKKTSFDNANHNNNNNRNAIVSDFICGEKKISYQPDEKTMKLLKELELDSQIFDNTVEVESKQCKEVIVTNKKKHKRNYIESNKDLPHQPLPILNKQKQFKHVYKFTKDKALSQIKLPSLNSSFDLKTIGQCEYICLCEGVNRKCNICNGTVIINKTNFHIGFYESQQYKDLKLNDNSLRELISSSSDDLEEEKGNKIISFFKYQYRFLSWKQYVLNVLQNVEPKNLFSKQSLCNIYENLTKKYFSIIVEDKRSFLMKVSEKDLSINVNMILIILNITYDEANKNYTLELSDGYKSVYSIIEHNNRIYGLIEKKTIYLGMKLNIGMAKISKITEDFEVFISIYYNSIALSKWNTKLGPIKTTRYLLKNLSNVLTEGGDISMINVIILKKYDYYITDMDRKESYSKEMFEKMSENYIEEYYNQKEEEKIIMSPKEISDNPILKSMENVNGHNNIRYNFRIICVDALVYYDYMSIILKSEPHTSLLKSNTGNLLKKLQVKKCIINFTSKSINLFEKLTVGNVCRFMLLNISNGNGSSYYKYSSNQHCELRIKANDSVRFIMEQNPSEAIKDNKQYQDMISRISLNVFQAYDDACELFVKENYLNDVMLNKDFFFIGCFLNKLVFTTQKKKEEEKEICYLVFGSSTKICVLLKINHIKYFDLDVFKKLNNTKGYNKVFQWENVKFEQALYYDRELNKLIPLRADKDKEKKDSKTILLCLETNYYSNFKPINYRKDNKETLKNIEWDILFKEETIDAISSCL